MPIAVAASGDFDRRIQIEAATETADHSNDPILSWAYEFSRWARKRDAMPRELEGAAQVLRQFDCIWELRDDSESRAIFPESHRVVWQSQIYEIVGRVEATVGRADRIFLLTASRPDGRGARGPNGTG